jgi:xanthine dehydrogenase molybdenum-binding subunit
MFQQDNGDGSSRTSPGSGRRENDSRPLLVGRDYTTLDVVAKVTGRAKYAEDYRVDGMLFCKLLLSPMPHARVLAIDTAAAAAMPGVKAILTVDDLPESQPGTERAVTDEPLYQGEPILAVAAVDELTAAEAIERIAVDYELLPFVVDPVDSLKPDGPNARREGNVWFPAPASPDGAQAVARPEIRTIKWNAEQMGDVAEGRLPMGSAPEEWTYGDLDAGFRG